MSTRLPFRRVDDSPPLEDRGLIDDGVLRCALRPSKHDFYSWEADAIEGETVCPAGARSFPTIPEEIINLKASSTL